MLPTKKREPIKDLSQEIIFIYGLPKIGKSSFASCFSNAVFLSTEKGLNHLEVYEVEIKRWLDFLTALDDLEKDPKDFKTVIIDTADNLFMFCQEWVYQKYNIRHESDLEWGKGWAMVEKEFRRQLTRLSKIRTLGLVLVSHSEQRDIKKRGIGEPETIITHTLPNKARKLISGMADMILFFEVDDKGNRVIRTKPTTGYEAGDRTGRLPGTLPLNYEAFLKAYYGKGAPDDTGRKEIVALILKGLEYLKEKEIDSFHIPKRVVESMKKHLDFPDLEHTEITMTQLQAYRQHLRSKALEIKKENKDAVQEHE